jgi:hypothetical protein
MSSDDSAPRVQRYRVQLKERGLKRVEVVVHQDDEEELRRLARVLLEKRGLQEKG